MVFKVYIVVTFRKGKWPYTNSAKNYEVNKWNYRYMTWLLVLIFPLLTIFRMQNLEYFCNLKLLLLEKKVQLNRHIHMTQG